jgi:hypothetical protein
MQPINRRRFAAARTKPEREDFWFHWFAKSARSYANGCEYRFWASFKDWLGNCPSWLGPRVG